ncbi:MAG: LabA-like NYN domain-containing protein [Candidatus Hodarchaeales archaeon]
MTSKRVAMFIDAGNLYHAAKNLGFKVDFLRLRDYFVNPDETLFEVFYYTAYDPSEAFIIRILDWLQHNGFIVVSKQVKKKNGLFFKGDMDVDIVVDMLLNIEKYEKAILFSGDGDFKRCVVELQKRGKTVQIVSSLKTDPPMISEEFRKQADIWTELTEIIPFINHRD